MAWTEAQLDRIGRTDTVEISSYRRDGTLRRWTPIWIVRAGDELYIRSAYGTEGGWYRYATRSSAARLRAGGEEVDIALEPAADQATNDAVAAAYEAKYHAQPSSLRPMLAPPAAGTTTRVVPATAS